MLPGQHDRLVYLFESRVLPTQWKCIQADGHLCVVPSTHPEAACKDFAIVPLRLCDMQEAPPECPPSLQDLALLHVGMDAPSHVWVYRGDSWLFCKKEFLQKFSGCGIWVTSGGNGVCIDRYTDSAFDVFYGHLMELLARAEASKGTEIRATIYYGGAFDFYGMTFMHVSRL